MTQATFLIDAESNIRAALAAFGGVLSLRDFRYHLRLFGALWSGQKIDGTQPH